MIIQVLEISNSTGMVLDTNTCETWTKKVKCTIL